MARDRKRRVIARPIRVGSLGREEVKPIAVQQQIEIATDGAVRALERDGAEIAADPLTK
jgi:hypothetical protein